jgi:hypothetical protein
LQRRDRTHSLDVEEFKCPELLLSNRVFGVHWHTIVPLPVAELEGIASTWEDRDSEVELLIGNAPNAA